MLSTIEELLHPSIWIQLLIIAAGVGLFVSGNRRLDKSLQRVGAVVAVAGLLLAGYAWFNPSAQQRMEARTKQIVAAIDKRNWTQLASLLDEHSLLGTPSSTIETGRDAIVADTEKACTKYNVTSVSVLSTQSQRTETIINVTVKVISEQDPTEGRPLPSTCEMIYQQDGDNWLLQKIVILKIGDNDADQIGGVIGH